MGYDPTPRPPSRRGKGEERRLSSAVVIRRRQPPLVAITGGGTGGHVYPGLAVAAALGREASASDGPAARVLYVGSQSGMERDLVGRAGLPFVGVESGALRGKGPAAQAGGVLRLGRGVAQALDIIRQRKVAAILATGGYVSAPVVIAGWLARVPALIYLPDVEPGLAVKFLSHFARRVAVTSEHSRQFLPAGKVVVTGYPLRQELMRAERPASRQRLGLAAEEKALLVLGGSRGAHSINAAIAAALPELLERAVVLHSSGPPDEAWLRQVADGLPGQLQSRYRLAAYMHEELAPAMAGANLAISRAGASVMGEYPYFGLPSVLIPYPYAGAHQERNADYLMAKGAAVKLADGEIGGGALPATVAGLLADEERLAGMGAAARALARPDAAEAIGQELLRLCWNE